VRQASLGRDAEAHIGSGAGQGCSGGQGRQTGQPRRGGLDGGMPWIASRKRNSVLARFDISIGCGRTSITSAVAVAARRFDSAADLRAFLRGLPRWIRPPGWRSRGQPCRPVGGPPCMAAGSPEKGSATLVRAPLIATGLRCSAATCSNCDGVIGQTPRFVAGQVVHQGLGRCLRNKGSPTSTPTCAANCADGIDNFFVTFIEYWTIPPRSSRSMR